MTKRLYVIALLVAVVGISAAIVFGLRSGSPPTVAVLVPTGWSLQVDHKCLPDEPCSAAELNGDPNNVVTQTVSSPDGTVRVSFSLYRGPGVFPNLECGLGGRDDGFTFGGNPPRTCAGYLDWRMGTYVGFESFAEVSREPVSGGTYSLSDWDKYHSQIQSILSSFPR